MPRKCSICIHKRRNEIETDILNNVPYRDISAKYNVGRMPVQRHKQNGHIAESLIKAHEINKIVNADDLLVKILHLQKETLIVLGEAKNDKNHNTILAAVGKAGQLIELQAKLAGQLQEGRVINIYVQPAFIKMQNIILEELDKYPEAKYRIAERLNKEAENV